MDLEILRNPVRSTGTIETDRVSLSSLKRYRKNQNDKLIENRCKKQWFGLHYFSSKRSGQRETETRAEKKQAIW